MTWLTRARTSHSVHGVGRSQSPGSTRRRRSAKPSVATASASLGSITVPVDDGLRWHWQPSRHTDRRDGGRASTALPPVRWGRIMTIVLAALNLLSDAPSDLFAGSTVAIKVAGGATVIVCLALVVLLTRPQGRRVYGGRRPRGGQGALFTGGRRHPPQPVRLRRPRVGRRRCCSRVRLLPVQRRRGDRVLQRGPLRRR